MRTDSHAAIRPVRAGAGYAVFAAAAIALTALAIEAPAQGFSLDAASPSATASSNSALLTAGPLAGPPVIAETAASIGNSGGATDELNAMHLGVPPPGSNAVLHFSVDRASVGLAGDVVAEAALGQAAGDVYAVVFPKSNVLVVNQDALGLAPAIAEGNLATPPIDDIDALDFDYTGPGPNLAGFMLAAGHLRSGTATGCGGDVFVGIGGALLGYGAYLGLASCDDDVDAYASDGTINTAFFSLAPGSPSLAPGSPITGCSSGCSPADVFVRHTGIPPTVAWTAAELGLLATDNVDAIAFADRPPTEPPTDATPIPVLSPLGRAGVVVLLIGLAAASRRLLQPA